MDASNNLSSRSVHCTPRAVAKRWRGPQKEPNVHECLPGSARRAVAAVKVTSSGRVRPPHPSQPPEMRRDTCAEGLELRVPDPKVSAGLSHELGNRRVIDVADPWEQVVFDLKVQAADTPCDYSTTPGEVHGRLY